MNDQTLSTKGTVASVSTPGHQVAFIDTGLPDYQTLIEGVSEGMEVVLVAPDQDGIQVMAEWAQIHSGVRAIHVLGHGTSGAQQLGDATLSRGTLKLYQDELSRIGQALAKDGDILLYGCEVAKTAKGETFVEALAKATGANIAASRTLTGAADLGGDWNLDVRIGVVTAGIGFSKDTQSAYRGHFATTIDYSGYTDATSQMNWVDGNDGVTDVPGLTLTLDYGDGTEDSNNFTNLQIIGLSNQVVGATTGIAPHWDNDSNGFQLVGDTDFSFEGFRVASRSVSSGDTFTIRGYDSGGTEVVSDTLNWAASGGSSFATYTIGSGDWNNDAAWGSVRKIVVDYTNEPEFQEFAIQTITVAPATAPANTPPELGGTPADDTATEDVATAIDLSAYDVSDADGDTITLTLAVDRGIIASTDGDGTTAGVTVANSGTASMTLQGTAADLNTYLNDASKIQYTTAANDTTAATLTVTPNDGTEDGTADTVAITILAVNDAPVLADTAVNLTTIVEDAGDDDGSGADGDNDATQNADNGGDRIADLLTAAITDPDGGAVEAIAVTQVDNTNGIWQYSTDGGSNWANFSGTTGSSVDISSAARLLDGDDLVRFVSDTDYNGTATFRFRAWDSSSGVAGGTADTSSNGGSTAFSSATDTASVTISAVSDAPVFSGLDGAPSFTEGGAVVQLDADATISDLELDALNGGNGDYSGATLTLARNGGSDASDLFSLVSGGNLTMAGGPDGGGTVSAGGNVIATLANTGPGQLQLSFADNGTVPTTALVNETLQAIRYRNGSDDPGASVQLDYTLSDGGASGSGSVTVAVTEVNDAPTLTVTGQDPDYAEGAAASVLFSGVTASTIESGQTLTGLTLTVTNVSDGANEILGIDGSDLALTDGNSITSATSGLAINCSVSGSTATVSFSGATLSEAALQTLVGGLSYRNGSDTPTTGSNRVVTITDLTDSGANGGSDDNRAALSLSSTVSLTAVNDAPVVSNAFTETSQIVAGAGAQNVDLFDDATVSNADSADYNGGFLTLAQTAGTTNGSWSLDGTDATSGGDAAVSAGETVQVGGSSIGTVDVTDDGQGGNTLTIHFSSADATSANLQTLLQNLNYSAPSGLGDRTFDVTLNDADGTANDGDADDSGSFTISVTPNPPVIGNLDGDSANAAEEGGAVPLDSDGNATVTDADSATFDGGSVTVSVTGNADAASDRLSVDTGGSISLAGTTAGANVSVSGTVIGTLGNNIAAGNDFVVHLNADATPARVQALLQALTFEATGDNPAASTRTLDIAVSDGVASDTVSVSVAVSAQNDVPQLVGLPADLSFTEDTQATLDLSAATLSDVDTTGSVTLTLTASAGTLSASSAGGVTAGGSGTASLTLTATIADLDTFLDGAHISHTPGADLSGNDATTISLSVNDGGSDTSLGSVNLDISAVNDAPVIATNAGASVPTGRTVTLTSAHLDEGDIDDDGAGLTYTLDSLPTEGKLLLSGTELAVNDTFTQQDIDDGNVTFTAGSGTGDVSVGFSLADGGEDGATPVTGSFDITVTRSPTPSPAPDDDLFSGNDGSEVDDGRDFGLNPTDDFSEGLIDGAPATTGRTTDRDTGEVVEVISVNPVTGADRVDDNDATPDVDIDIGNAIRATVSDSIGLVATQRRSESRDDLRVVIDRERSADANDEDRDGREAFLDGIANGGTPGDTVVTEVTPVSTTTGSGGARLSVDVGTSPATPVIVVDTRGLTTEGQTVSITGASNIVIRGSGSFDGSEELAAGGVPDVDNVLGDNSAQTLFFGPGDDVIRGQGGDDTVASAGGKDLLFGGRGDDTVSGGADDDRLVGGSGNDTLQGGTGVDVARFDIAAAEVEIRQAADGRLVVEAGEWGTDTLSGVELLRFDDQVVLVDAPDPLSVRGFDEAGYLARNPDVAQAVAAGDIASGYAHYFQYGADEGREADGLAGFDEAFYLALNPDVAEAVARGDFVSGYAHYRQYGASEGRDPNVLFDEAWYREHNADVNQAVERGEFDSAYQHFLAFGGREQRDASAWADIGEYLSRNPDVAAAEINPLAHYLQYGMQEGRTMTAADEGLW